jgi:hypothetical protein
MIIRILLVVSILIISERTIGQTNPSRKCTGSIVVDTSYSIQINPSLPIYEVHLLGRDSKDKEGYIHHCYEITISNKNNESEVGVLIGFPSSSFDFQSEEEYPGLSFIDANFDGYLDIKMYDGVSANGQNTAYNFYIFNPKTLKYIYDKPFSEKYGCNSYIDTSAKEIHTSGIIGCAGNCYVNEVYRSINGQMVLVSRESVDQDPNNPSQLIYSKEELINGVLKIVEREKR